MEPSTVDRLARAFAAAGTRRRLLALLGALPLAGALVPLSQTGVGEAGRRRRRKRRHDPGGDKRNRKGKRKGKRKHKPTPTPTPTPCVPEPQTTTCAGKCATVTNNCNQAIDCGACVCDPPCAEPCETCDTATGACVPAENDTPCDDGEACTTGDTCQAGVCTGTPVVCDDPPVCHTTADAACQAGVCTYPTREPDATPCGSGNVCCQGDCAECCDNAQCPTAAAPSCQAQTCVCLTNSNAPCSDGETCCDTGCQDLKIDPANCGTCGHACSGDTPYCWAGECVECHVCADGCPFSTVQAAIEAAPAGYTLGICPGTYGRTGNDTIATIKKSLTLIGAGQGAGGTILDGGAPSGNPIVTILDAPLAELRDLTVRGGQAEPDGFGAGIFVGRTKAVLTRVTVTDNHGKRGGGIHVNDLSAELTLTNCTVSFSSAIDEGGGIYNEGGKVTLNETTVTNCTAHRGGGMYTNNGTLILNGATVTLNEAITSAGGIFNAGAVIADAETDVSGNINGNCVDQGSSTGCPA